MVKGVFDVEKILEKKKKLDGSVHFLVKWKGFSMDKATWEPDSNLNCDEKLEEFLDVEHRVMLKFTLMKFWVYKIHKLKIVDKGDKKERWFKVEWRDLPKRLSTYESEEFLRKNFPKEYKKYSTKIRIGKLKVVRVKNL